MVGWRAKHASVARELGECVRRTGLLLTRTRQPTTTIKRRSCALDHTCDQAHMYICNMFTCPLSEWWSECCVCWHLISSTALIVVRGSSPKSIAVQIRFRNRQSVVCVCLLRFQSANVSVRNIALSLSTYTHTYTCVYMLKRPFRRRDDAMRTVQIC